ncbi:ACT domain-containing protein [bacterium]|nr:ACT domain-containing protein [bacterium]
MTKVAIGGMLETNNLVLVKVLGVRKGPGVAGLTLSTLGKRSINVLCIVSSSDASDRENMTLAVGKDSLDEALGILQSIKEDIEAQRIEVQRNCCFFSIYGPHFSERPSIAGLMFDAMAEAGIDIYAISTSVSTVSCVIDQGDLEKAREQIRATFLLP